MNDKTRETIKQLYFEYFNEEVNDSAFQELPKSGSYRTYWRIKGLNSQCLAAHNLDLKENRAFIKFAKQMEEAGVNVPKVYNVSDDEQIYLQEDLGDITLFSYLNSKQGDSGRFPDELVETYKRVIDSLIQMQIGVSETLDWSCCYPRSSFDEKSMMWDLNYFKYYFLKLAQVPFDEEALENDYMKFCKFLLEAPQDYFLFRDFQSRNIMLHNDTIYFIDFQGGRKGALQYDLASLLYDAKANIPPEKREELLDYYIYSLQKRIEVDRAEFVKHFHGYTYIRIMQAMGAYGFRGFYEKKEHFLKSIPFALRNINYLLSVEGLPIELPELEKVLRGLGESPILKELGSEKGNLKVSVSSFSFKKGYPKDKHGNGGGFVFDCRAIDNPGRKERFKSKTGRDKDVIEYIEAETDMAKFIEECYSLVKRSIENYKERKFRNLAVSFGCTGGQHRSVYAADRLAEIIRFNDHVEVEVEHREQAF